MFYPLFAMALLTTLVFATNLALRILAVRARTINVRHFKLLESDDPVPTYLQAGTRQMANLFETPVLFYVGGVLAIVQHAETAPLIELGWVYVALRLAHAVIHMTYNHVIHRLLVFTSSVVVLGIMWGSLLLHQLG